MSKTGVSIKFTGPDGWTEFREGPRTVYHGPNREELIVSGTLFSGEGSSAELESWRQVLFQRTIGAINRTSANPELRITSQLAPDSRVAEFECLTTRAETLTGETVFYQSVIVHNFGLLLVTFEASNSSNSETVFDRFLRTIQHP